MKERPILFRDVMVRAILRGRKSQTRRMVDVDRGMVKLRGGRSSLYLDRDGVPGLSWVPFSGSPTIPWEKEGVCPYGDVGDRLWVRETWRAVERESDNVDGILYDADNAFIPIENTAKAAEQWVVAYGNGKHGTSWRPSIFMPRWASRLLLEITQVRIQRLHEISEADAKAEGVEPHVLMRKLYPSIHAADAINYDYRRGFMNAWMQINGAESWDANPHVWAISFRVVEKRP